MEKAVLASVLELRTSGSSPLCLGTMNFGRRTNEVESKKILSRALELGIRHIDTANAYVDGASERIVGEALGRTSERDRVVIATKCGFGRVSGKPEGLSRARIRSAIDESRKRLGTDWVDIYYLHVPDHETAIEETLEAIAELLDQKTIRSWGVSNYAAWQVLEMMHLGEGHDVRPLSPASPDGLLKKHGLSKPVIAQQLYNVLIRQLDVEWFSFARRYRLHTTVYNPLAGGLLSGKHSRDGSSQKGSRFDGNRLYLGRYFTGAMFDRVDALADVARAEGMSLVELSYAWLARAPGVDSILLGPASVVQLDEGVRACGLELLPSARARVDALYLSWMGTDTKYVR